MFKKCIRLWKKMIYTWYLARCRSCYNLAKQAQQGNDISRAILSLDKAAIAGKKALNLLSEEYFPNSDKARRELQDVLETIEKYRKTILVLSQRRN